MTYLVELISIDKQKFQCQVEAELEQNEKEILKIAFEKIKKTIPDYISFGYKLNNIKELNGSGI